MVAEAPHHTTDTSKQKLLDRVVEVVEALPERERRTLEAVFWERKTFRALADEEGCHPKNVWRRYKRALDKVHAELGEVFG